MDRDPEMLWTMAPKPTMEDTMYNLDFPWDVKSTERKTWTENHKYQINETQPVSSYACRFYVCSFSYCKFLCTKFCVL